MTATQRLHRLRQFLPRGGALPPDAWEARHRGIAIVAWIHIPVVATIALLQGTEDAAHADHAAGLSQDMITLIGCVLATALAAVGSMNGSQRLRSLSVTLSLMVSTALLIHLFNGLIEMHFQFFVLIAVVSMYQSWTPYLVALGFVVAHHGLMGIVMPTQVYNHAAALEHPVAFSLLHGAFVLAESVACLTYWKINEDALDAERAERARAEAMGEHLARANREISDLLAMMSHDLRAPVTVINGYASMALESWGDLDDDTLRGFVQKMGTAGRSLEEMLDDTLTMSAHDAEGLHSRPVAVRLDEAVRAALETQTDHLRVDLSDLRPVAALVDKGQLHQILTNLITNAQKYGAQPLSVACDAADDEVWIVVSDSGAGVPAEFVPRLFDRYARADEARRGSKRGTGLGLYIVRQLAESNQGSVRYETSSSGGASFVIRLPRAPRLALPVPPMGGRVDPEDGATLATGAIGS